MNSSSAKFKTIDAYIKSSPKVMQKMLSTLRKKIRVAAPKAEESISYGMPAYKLHNKPLAYFGAFTKHVGFFPTSSPIAAFKKELTHYESAKGSVQFPLDKPLPLSLIGRMVKFRVKQIESKKP